MVAVDNTFLSPVLQQPLAFGADFVVHSTTKFLNGHSDVVGGALVTASPFDAYLTLRGVRTLFPRIEEQQRNAAAVADFLDRDPVGSVVHYPGLPAHPGHAIAARQQRGFGATLRFDIEGGAESVLRFVGSVRVLTLAESLGGVERLVAHPATKTHLSMGAEARLRAGISDSLLRISIGLESEEGLIADLDQALRSATAPA